MRKKELKEATSYGNSDGKALHLNVLTPEEEYIEKVKRMFPGVELRWYLGVVSSSDPPLIKIVQYLFDSVENGINCHTLDFCIKTTQFTNKRGMVEYHVTKISGIVIQGYEIDDGVIGSVEVLAAIVKNCQITNKEK